MSTNTPKKLGQHLFDEKEEDLLVSTSTHSFDVEKSADPITIKIERLHKQLDTQGYRRYKYWLIANVIIQVIAAPVFLILYGNYEWNTWLILGATLFAWHFTQTALMLLAIYKRNLILVTITAFSMFVYGIAASIYAFACLQGYIHRNPCFKSGCEFQRTVAACAAGAVTFIWVTILYLLYALSTRDILKQVKALQNIQL